MKTAQRRPTDRKQIFSQFAQKAVVGAEERTFEGILAAYTKDNGNDVIRPGAFARTLGTWKASNGSVIIPLIDQHGYDSIRRVIGKLLEAEERPEGLWTKWLVVPGRDGDEALERVKGAFVTGMSIGYRAVKWTNVQPEGTTDPWDAIRYLDEVQLYEGSLVIWGMNEDALTDPTSVKSLLEGMKAGTLTDEQKTELKELHQKIGALLTDPPADEPEEEAKGLAPDSAERVAIEATIREIEIRSLGIVL